MIDLPIATPGPPVPWNRRTAVVLLCLAATSISGCDPAVEEVTPVPQPSMAADFRSERVGAVLDAAGHVVQTRGFSADGSEWRGFLIDQGSEVLGASLRAESCYIVLGAGSSALEDLDLRVFDSDGREVAQDAQPGPGAALRYCPPHTGTYYMTALATAGTGLFGVRRYSGPTGLDVRLDDVFRDTPTPEGVPAEHP